MHFPPDQSLGSSSHADELRHRNPDRLELITLLHVAGLLVFTTWDFGGETDLSRVVVSGWGSLAVFITIAGCLRRLRRREGLPAAVRWFWPLVLFDALVLLSTLNPSLTRSVVGGAEVFVLGGAIPGWPSSARPALSWQVLWQCNAIYLTCFNLVVVVVRRRVLRMLLFMLSVDALLLAIMGTFQKLAHAPGLYFGSQRSPNEAFFATFIYHNHWGAFAVLATAAALGLLFHYSGRTHESSRRHSPAFFGLIATLLLAVSVPLSSSRSCSVLVLVLLTAALFHWLRRLWRERQNERRSILAPVALALAVFLAGLSGIYLVGRPVIVARINKTQEQIEQYQRLSGQVERPRLYADTWRMAREKLWFGWGLGSYGTVFQMFNQQVSVEGWVPFYARAHSDWLQSVAEVGLVGTMLIALIGAVPLSPLRRFGRLGAIPAYLLGACALIAAYAFVEFPFANPAVMEAFGLCFFTALRYQKLSVSRA